MTHNYKCDKCDKCFTQKANVRRHMENIHDHLKPHKCEHCEFTTHHKPNLKKHSCYVKLEMPKIPEGVESSGYSIEYYIQSKLEKELKGYTQSCPFGRIDILTEHYIIEIKMGRTQKQ